MQFIQKIFLILLMGIVHSFPQTNFSEEIKKQITLIKEEFVPDKRTALFEINIDSIGNTFIISGETNLPEAKNKLLDELKNLSASVTDKIELLPSKELAGYIYGIVNLSTANIRTEPKNSAELSTQALLGCPVKVLKKKGGWFYIQTPDEYLGWVDDDGIQIMNEAEFHVWNGSEKIIFTDMYGLSFSEKDIKSVPVSDLVTGNILKEISSDENYIEAEYPDKRIAFLLRNQTRPYSEWLEDFKLTEGNILHTAKSFIGIPYLWGGTSVKGFDCSGFTKTVYFLNGLILPRDASQQVRIGTTVETSNGFENLLPGDLLFFGSKGDTNKKERISHVAIYLGNKEFIHASGRVRINSLDSTKENFSEYRFKTFVRAKRILNTDNLNGIKPVINLFINKNL
jgi:hypothetical protein